MKAHVYVAMVGLAIAGCVTQHTPTWVWSGKGPDPGEQKFQQERYQCLQHARDATQLSGINPDVYDACMGGFGWEERG